MLVPVELAWLVEPDGVGVALPDDPVVPDGDGVGLPPGRGELDEGRGAGLGLRVLVGWGTGVTGRDAGTGVGVGEGMMAEEVAGLTTT